MADSKEEDENLASGIASLKADISESLLHLSPPPQAIQATPTSQPPMLNIDYEGDLIMGDNGATPVGMRVKCMLGKLYLFAISHSADEGPNLLTLCDSITELFGLTNTCMSEAFGNLLLSTSEEQANSLDCINQQKLVPDFAATL